MAPRAPRARSFAAILEAACGRPAFLDGLTDWAAHQRSVALRQALQREPRLARWSGYSGARPVERRLAPLYEFLAAKSARRSGRASRISRPFERATQSLEAYPRGRRRRARPANLQADRRGAAQAAARRRPAESKSDDGLLSLKRRRRACDATSIGYGATSNALRETRRKELTYGSADRL